MAVAKPISPADELRHNCDNNRDNRDTATNRDMSISAIPKSHITLNIRHFWTHRDNRDIPRQPRHTMREYM
jgi:hypothetical protein